MDLKRFTKSKSGKLVKTIEGASAFVPDDLPPELSVTWELVNQNSEADRRLSELAGAARTLPNPHLLIAPFTRREAVLSSRIEGTVASISDVFAFEGAGAIPNERRDVLEVANYVQALEYGIDQLEKLPVSLRLIKEVHKRLMRGVRGHHMTPGEFRRSQNWIGPPGSTRIQDATFIPPPIPEMHRALDNFEKFLHGPRQLPPLVRMAIAHYQFETIHPFFDGNGRVGRLLITLLLISEQLLPQPLLYLSAFFERYRQEYYRLLFEVSCTGSWHDWILFFLRGVAEQAQDALDRSKNLQSLLSRYRATLHDVSSSANVLHLTEHLFARPFITVAGAAEELQVSVPAAQKMIEKLVAARILQEITGRQRNRIYRAHEIMSIIEGPQQEQHSLFSSQK